MSIRIAIIEDEYFFRQALKKYIAGFGEGFEVTCEARNGQEGLQLLRRERVDIALVDITMPLMNGLEMIQRAVEEGIDTQIVILTGYGEFNYARSAIQLGVRDYLLKPLPPESLRQCLDKLAKDIVRTRNEVTLPQPSVRNIMRVHLAEQLTRGGQHSIGTDLMFEYLDFPREGSQYCVALLQTGPSTALEAAMHALDQSIRQTLEGCGVHALWYTHDARSICLVAALHVAEDPMPALLALLTDISRRVEDAGEALMISVGAPVARVDDICTSYLQARTIQYYHLFRTDVNIATYASDRAVSPSTPVYGTQEQHQLMHALRGGSEQAVQQLLGEQFTHIEAHAADANAVYMWVATMLSVILEFSPAPTSDADASAAAFPAIFVMRDIKQLHAFVVEQALQAMRRIAPDDGAHKSTINRVNAYIEAQFQNPALCLEDIARAHAISVQYLCMLYKRHMNMTIGDYLFDVRMNRAQRLLESGQGNVSLVAEQCGYHDIGYFGKCFKKKYGLSPTQYLSMRAKHE